MKTRTASTWVGLVSITLAGAAIVSAYEIDWYSVDGGGGTSAGGVYEVTGTAGQPDARNHPEPMTGGTYELTGGFWVMPQCPAIPADYDVDCDVDQADFALFEACTSGPDISRPAYCADMDFDSDNDVDQDDFATFQRCFSGPNNPGDPYCAD